MEACQKVAEKHAVRLSASVPALDLAIVSPQSFSCLVLEIWASEIYDKLCANQLEEANEFVGKMSERKWQPSQDSGLIDWLSEGEGANQSLNVIYQKEPRMLKRHSLELYKTWLLLVEVLDLSKFVEPTSAFDIKTREADPSAVAARHWYKTASKFEENFSPLDPVVPVRLPGRFTIRGDWFLAVAGGSRSGRLADRALDLLSSQRANLDRLQLGLGLPTRRIVNEDEYQHLRTKLLAPSPDDERSVTYANLLRISGRSISDSDKLGVGDFFWLWRSGLGYYHRQGRILDKWLKRMLLWWERLRYKEKNNWRSGFEVYDLLIKQEFHEVSKLESWQNFPKLCDFLIAELRQATLVDPR